jgi:HAD superfamily hydrolase (TIGR01509 family)
MGAGADCIVMSHDRALAGVLFDMDGTLLESEQLWDRALCALAERHGGTLSTAALHAMTGRNAVDSMRIFYAELGITGPDYEADTAFLGRMVADLFATELCWRPGAHTLVTQVRQAGLPMALVTSTHRRLVEVALASTLGHDTFDVVVCGDEVGTPKPHPESYRTAAARLGVPIGRCVAIEDSPTGIASASAAGAVVVAVPNKVSLAGLDGAHLVRSLVEVDLNYLSTLVASSMPSPTGDA